LISLVLAILGVAVWVYQSKKAAGTAAGTPSAPVAMAPIMEPEAQAFAGYAGSKSCRECHTAMYDDWAKSNHGLAERPLREDLDKATFEPAKSFQHGTQTTEARVKDGKHEVVTLGFDNKREPYEVDRVIGNDPLRQYLVKAFGGRLQTLETAYDPHKNEWFNVYGNEDRKPGEWGHWTGRGMTWNTMCAACHNTRLRKNYDAPTDSFHTTMAEMTVSCEACHGPMKAHVEWRKKYPDKAKPDPTITKHTPTQTLDTCGSCHSRRTEITGDFKPGDNYFDHHALAIVDETNLFHPDGQVRDEDYEFSSFLSSKMHTAGVKCSDCHNPHTAKVILPGNNLCMRCHTAPTPAFPKAPVINPVAHTFHQPESTGSQCINCHMPQTVYMQRHSRHDHSFSIPDPLLTKQIGVPNACNRCHTDKDTDWSLAATEKWYGAKMARPTRQRALTIAAARNGDPASRDGLVKLIESETESPSWKASAIRLLDPFMLEPSVFQKVMPLSTHADPMVRASVARSMEPLLNVRSPSARATLDKMFTDPIRSVRLAAAWSLRATLDEKSPTGQELKHMLDQNGDQPSGQLQIGAYHFARKENDEALKHYQTAVKWDPNSAAIRHELAVAYSSVGKQTEALRELEEAVRLEPNTAEYRFKLALGWNEMGDAEKTIAALEQTVKIDPHHARAWYNLGLARNAKGDAVGAIDALKHGEQANPEDGGIPYARATIHARLRQLDEAREAAMKAVQLDPSNQDAIQLMGSLQRQQR
jgi:Flp pilus assembly protein TadD